ncbi:Uncharacterised protein [Mycobacteroides abscessus subsp. abscessus]|nr:Uncharacterised protein [Mycobacteroides abscessus subsp. abscessus]
MTARRPSTSRSAKCVGGSPFLGAVNTSGNDVMNPLSHVIMGV